MTFVLNRVGGGEVLKELAAEAVTQLALEVSADAGPSAVVETRVSKTRFVATIKVAADEQATDGVLSRAVSQAGLTLNAYKRQFSKPKSTTTTTGRKRGRPRKNTT